MRIDTGDDEQPEIGLIALIDCIFFLLMFFMVATSFKQKEQQHKDKPLPIVLPRASASPVRAEAAPDPLVIRVDRAGAISVGGAALSTEALHERLRDEAPRFAQIFPQIPRLVHQVLHKHAHSDLDMGDLMAKLVENQRRTNRLLAVLAFVTGVAVVGLAAMHFVGF